MSRFFLMLLAKNQQNRPMFYGVIQKLKVARFLSRHGVFKIKYGLLVNFFSLYAESSN